jgi:NTP pyrophosphatase (non-canonical NTP hydrolase)
MTKEEIINALKSWADDCEDFVLETDFSTPFRADARMIREAVQIIENLAKTEAKAAAIISHYGAEHQKDILIEECAELIQAVEKSRRGILTEDKPAYTYDMISEMADVQIMLWQFESVMTAYSRQCFEDEVYRKLRRQLERIENGE